MARRIGQRERDPEELVARVEDFRQNYFVSRVEGPTGTYVDDESILEVMATIISISTRHEKRLGESISIRLLHSMRYRGETHDGTPFFGTVNLRATVRSVVAYLPAEPFWRLPTLIEGGADTIELRFAPLHNGYGDLLSLFLGIQDDTGDPKQKAAPSTTS